MTKSTHSGHCQACGRLQKLPKGVLALHGYTVAFGFFSGTCSGSKHLPFEISCDMLPTFIANATKALTELESFHQSLRTPTESTQAWFNTSKANRKGRYYSRDSRWELCTISAEVKSFHGSTDTYLKFTRDGNTQWTRTRNEQGHTIEVITPEVSDANPYHESFKTIGEVATKANTAYAQWLEREAQNLRRYIAYQQARVDNWKAMPLLPNDAKDKEGFDADA